MQDAATENAKPDEGYRFSSPRGEFSIVFPVQPKTDRKSTPVDGPVQKLSPMYVWEAKVGETRYILYFFNAPADVLDAEYQPEKLANLAREKLPPMWHEIKRRSTTIDDQAAMEVEFAKGNRERSSVSVFTRFEDVVLSLSVNSDKEVSWESKEVKDFFGSLHFKR